MREVWRILVAAVAAFLLAGQAGWAAERGKTQFPPAPVPPFEAQSEEESGEAKAPAFKMGTQDNMRSGKNEDGDSVMEIKSRPKPQQDNQQQSQYPIIVAPQVYPNYPMPQGQNQGQQGQYQNQPRRQYQTQPQGQVQQRGQQTLPPAGNVR